MHNAKKQALENPRWQAATRYRAICDLWDALERAEQSEGGGIELQDDAVRSVADFLDVPYVAIALLSRTSGLNAEDLAEWARWADRETFLRVLEAVEAADEAAAESKRKEA